MTEATIMSQRGVSEYGEAKEAVLTEFAATLGCLHTPGRDTLHVHPDPHGVTGTIRVGTPESISFTLDGLSAKKARWIVALLQKLTTTPS